MDEKLKKQKIAASKNSLPADGKLMLLFFFMIGDRCKKDEAGFIASNKRRRGSGLKKIV